MLRRIRQQFRGGEDGQSLVLLAFALIVVMGAAGMSIDVGRAYWAKTQLQNAVDASALAAAQSLPDTTTATAQANLYWDKNNNYLEANASSLTFTPSYNLASTKEVSIAASANVNTWFARVLGLNNWHISASATAEFQQVDAMLVLDRSGSMCYDSHGPGGNFYGLIRLSDGNVSTSSTSMPSSDAVNSTRVVGVTKHSSVSSTSLNSLVWVGQRFKWDSTSEWMEITAINNGASQITVKRGVGDPNTSNSSSTVASHSAGTSAWLRGSTCTQAGLGPFLPWEYVKTGGSVFVNNMNSTYDQVGYVDFGSVAELNMDFTTNFTTLKNTISNTRDPGVMTASKPNGDDEDHYTNIAHGLWYGVNRHLTSPSKRAGAVKVVVLLSDGVANKYCSNAANAASQSTTCTDTQNTTTATSWTVAAANYAKANNVKVYTISYGAGADTSLMQQVADITGGKHYVAPDEATLNTAFQAIAKSTHVKLTH